MGRSRSCRANGVRSLYAWMSLADEDVQLAELLDCTGVVIEAEFGVSSLLRRRVFAIQVLIWLLFIPVSFFSSSISLSVG